ncbi:MAG TPA: hypothetical protein VKV15_21285 [Bryobacteraceae bacterium]|nr:hypothetical protein [Bryobacteraceae bacterium]
MAWPSEWTAVRERLSARLLGERLGPDQASTLIEVPRFGPDGGDASNGRRPAEQEWLLIDLDVDYTRGTLLPAMLNRYLGDSGLDYDAEVVVNGNPSQQIYRSPSDHDHRSRLTADASVALLDTGPMTFSPNNRPLYGGPAHSGPPRPGPPPPDS